MLNARNGIFSIDYRHYICFFACAASACCAVYIFPEAFGRLIEGCRDFGISVAYFFCKMFSIDADIVPTVTQMPSVPSAPEVPAPPSGSGSTWFPESLDVYNMKLGAYGQSLISAGNVLRYLNIIGNICYYISIAVLIVLPFWLLLRMLFRKYFEHENTDHGYLSRPLSIWLRFTFSVYYPVKCWAVRFFDFVRTYRAYWIVCALLWAYSFRWFTVVLEAAAYYFYFVFSLDFVSLYVMVYKLFYDFAPMLRTVPVPVWIVFLAVLFDRLRKQIGYMILNMHESDNRRFISERPLVFMLTGTMAKGKTKSMTDMALSTTVMFRDKVYELLLENDLKFPHFCWQLFESDLRTQMESGAVYNLTTARIWVQTIVQQYFAGAHDLYDYDYGLYGVTYNDGAKLVTLFDVLDSYARLYFVYVINTSLLVSNYAIREDQLLEDLGNLPRWNSEFFRNDPKKMDAHSRHSHIIDFDMFRLGKMVVENNEHRGLFEFGIVVLTEIGKERGNQNDTKTLKKDSKLANQNNDYFNRWLKMCRHVSTIDGFSFVRVFGDDQRPESLGADARELCDIVRVVDTSERKLAMPFFTIEALLHDLFFGFFKKLYSDFRFYRGDDALLMYGIKQTSARAHGYYNRINNRFGYETLSLEVERGTMDAAADKKKYYLSFKKIYSRRYSTDCYGEYFANMAMQSRYGLAQLRTYASALATFEELKLHNSYFIRDLLGITQAEQDAEEAERQMSRSRR